MNIGEAVVVQVTEDKRLQVSTGSGVTPYIEHGTDVPLKQPPFSCLIYTSIGRKIAYFYIFYSVWNSTWQKI